MTIFERHKSYRTAGGHIMQITTEVNSGGFCAKQTDGPEFERITLMYRHDGTAMGTGWGAHHILPGAIEDEPKAKTDDVHADTCAWIHTMAGLWSRANPSAVVDDLDMLGVTIVKKEPKAEQRTGDGRGFIAPPVEDREQMSDLRQIHSRLNRQAEKIEELRARAKEHTQLYLDLSKESDARTSAMVERIEALTRDTAAGLGQNEERTDNIEKHCEAMEAKLADAMDSGKAHSLDIRRKHHGLEQQLHARMDFLEKRLDAHREVIGGIEQIARCAASATEELELQMPAALGLTPDPSRPATPVEQAINALHDRIEALENYTSLDVRSANGKGREQAHREGGPTIKGGWVNVYEAVGYADMTGPYSRRDLADDGDRRDKRVRRACIQIPDIQEGEGL